MNNPFAKGTAEDLRKAREDAAAARLAATGGLSTSEQRNLYNE